MKHIVQFSGGKDSTCMLLMMLERGMQVDEITFCDTGMEFPQMYEHIDKVERYIGRPITRLKREHSFEYMMFEHQKTKGKRIGEKGYGWATMQNRWCTRYFKEELASKHIRGQKALRYIGIAFDEPKRHINVHKNIRHPLFEWQITEKMALEYCYNHGFDWGGLYEKFRRVSCWCCPLQPISELRTLYHDFPSWWTKLLEMDKRSITQFHGKIVDKFRPDYSVEQLEQRFIREDNGKRIAISLWDE